MPRQLGHSSSPRSKPSQTLVSVEDQVMRKLAYLVGLFLLAGLPAVAQEGSSKDVSIEYSYLRANPSTTGFPSFNSNGGSASFAYNPRSSYGFVGEFSGYHVGDIGNASVNTDVFTYMAGPQIYFHHYSRFTPFVQDLFGVAHTNAFGTTHNSFAMAAGAGVDVRRTCRERVAQRSHGQVP